MVHDLETKRSKLWLPCVAVDRLPNGTLRSEVSLHRAWFVKAERTGTLLLNFKLFLPSSRCFLSHSLIHTLVKLVIMAQRPVFRLPFSSLLVLVFFLFSPASSQFASTASAVNASSSALSAVKSSSSSNGNLTLSRPFAKNTTHYYPPLYKPHYNSTPKFQNVTGKTVNPLVVALQGANAESAAAQPVTRRNPLLKRDLPTGTCAPGTPCVEL